VKTLFILLMVLTASCTYLGGPSQEGTIGRDIQDSIPSRFDLRGGIKFNHKLHYDTMGFPCTRCHGVENPQGGKIKGFGFAYALANCVGCHKNTKHAPTACNGCHEMRELPKGFSAPQ